MGKRGLKKVNRSSERVAREENKREADEASEWYEGPRLLSRLESRAKSAFQPSILPFPLPSLHRHELVGTRELSNGSQTLCAVRKLP